MADDDKSARRRAKTSEAELIEAGLAEFAERGFAAARLDDVAKRAGVAKGTIYLYFNDKEDLFRAAVRSRIGGALAGAESMAAMDDLSAEQALRAVLVTAHRNIAQSDAPILIRILIAEGGRFPDLLSFYHTEVISKGRALLTRLIQRGVENGEFRAGATTTELPMLVIAPALMAVLWRLLFDDIDPIDPERFLEAHLDLVFDGVRRA